MRLTLSDPVHFPSMPTEPQPAQAADDALLDELVATVAVPDAAADLVPADDVSTTGVDGFGAARDGVDPGARPVTGRRRNGSRFTEAKPAGDVVGAPAVAPRRAPLRARQVERLVRRVSLWSVLRFSLVFYTCLWLITTVAGVILWRVARSGGLLDNAESFLAELLSLESFSIDGGSVLRASALGGVVLVVAGTAMTVLLAVIFNLISEITGGVRVAVVELETARPAQTGELPSRWRRRAATGSGSPVAERVR